MLVYSYNIYMEGFTMTQYEYYKNGEFGWYCKKEASSFAILWFVIKHQFCIAFANKSAITGRQLNTKLDGKTLEYLGTILAKKGFDPISYEKDYIQSEIECSSRRTYVSKEDIKELKSKLKMIQNYRNVQDDTIKIARMRRIVASFIIGFSLLITGIILLSLSILLELAITMTVVGGLLFLLYIAVCLICMSLIKKETETPMNLVTLTQQNLPPGFDFSYSIIPIKKDGEKPHTTVPDDRYGRNETDSNHYGSNS